MPIEVDQKQLSRAYKILNTFSIIYVFTPFVIVLYVVDWLITYKMTDIFYIVIMIACFTIFAKRVFVNHERVTYLFDGLYKGADKAKIKKYWGIKPIGNRLYGWLPLPMYEPPRKKWRSGQ